LVAAGLKFAIPQGGMGEIRDLDRALKEALDAKFIPSAKTAKDVEGMIDIVYKPAK
jgi:hypothetical protein